MIEVTLPWPDKRLSPNARVHWRKKAEAASDALEDAYWATYQNDEYLKAKYLLGWCINGKPLGLEAKYTFYPPDRRRRDIDNLHSQEKNYQDGVCNALGIDDSRIKRTVLEWGDVVKGGKVVLRLEEMDV